MEVAQNQSAFGTIAKHGKIEKWCREKRSAREREAC